jgi:hypothetical protein
MYTADSCVWIEAFVAQFSLKVYTWESLITINRVKSSGNYMYHQV